MRKGNQAAGQNRAHIGAYRLVQPSILNCTSALLPLTSLAFLTVINKYVNNRGYQPFSQGHYLVYIT